jgi:PucR C-terminal helix-turn-helix domain
MSLTKRAGMSDSARPFSEIRELITRGLQARRSEIEQAIYTRIHSSVPHPASRENPDYEAGLREAIAAVVGYGLEVIKVGPGWSGPVPPAAVVQARRAARVGVSCGTIQRRYFVGHREFGKFVAQEIERTGFMRHGEVVHHLLQVQEELLEQLTAAIEYEYNEEHESIGGSRRSEIAQRLISGEPVKSAELTELDYEIDTSWHIGFFASGPGAEGIFRTLKRNYSRKLLCVYLDNRVCAWLGMQKEPVLNDEYLSPNGDAFAVGEPGKGFEGWRLTHHQARAAFAVALRRPEKIARYADTRLLAAALQNETLAQSLTQRYLMPLSTQSDGGAKLRRTLRTYIDLECNASSAANGLRVRRHTVACRVRTAEQLIGSTLRDSLAELDVALRLEELNSMQD